MITLIITDCQVDYIAGSLASEESKKIITPIVDFIENNYEIIDKIIFTTKQHPYNHCSFKKFNGKYPVNCVQYTPGACIEPKLLKTVHKHQINYEVSCREMYAESIQNGAFYDIDVVKDALGLRYYFDNGVCVDANTDLVICGISTYMNSTISNLLMDNINVKILFPDLSLNNFIKNNNIEIYEQI